MTDEKHGGDSSTIFCVMRPKPEKATTLRNALASFVEPTRSEPGCLAYDP